MTDIKPYKEALDNAIINADVIRVFENLLTIWVELWASDIHIEPFETYSRIRIRIDWMLQELVQYPKNIHDSVIAKFKIESWQMRPDEKRLPQDARVSSVTLTQKEIDLRASTLPTVWWEKLVMRIVDKSKKIPPLEVMWIDWSNKAMLQRNLDAPDWIILTTWPTGSWKSTTLYAALEYLNTIDTNITTYEDPVENKMNWVNQSQVRADIGYTFAQGLRAALRQDPDIIMVWEMRDLETVEIAMEAAMTWHMVLSTIHTNSAAETITRVMNMWVKPYMIAWTFNLVMAQRLVRRVDPNSQKEVNIKKTNPQAYNMIIESILQMWNENAVKELKLRGIDPNQLKEWIFYEWVPNPETWTSWYKWRVWVFEFMEYTDELRQMLLDWKSSFEIEKYMLKQWMITLERDGIMKALQGKMTIDELYKMVKHKKV